MDLRIALRTLSRQPAFCLAAIITLALGIGANTAIFSVFDAVILRPLPYPNAGRLVLVWQKRPDGRENGVAGLNYLAWIKHTRSFERLEGFIPQFYNMGARGETVQSSGARVSSGFLAALGVQPVLGRGLSAADEQPGAPPVTVLSYGLWQSLLGGDRNAIGKPIEMNGDAYIVVGVMPRNFDFAGQDIQVWTPLIFKSQGELESNKMLVLGRLKPGVPLKQANREMEVVSKNLEPEFPDYKGWSAMVKPLQDLLEGHIRPALTALLVGVGLVLLIACTNVANLMLARSDVRSKEVAIRSALGANHGGLIRQLLTETMLLAFAGSLAGLVFAWAGLRLLVTVAAGQLPRIESVSLDARVLTFTLVVTIVTGLLFGLLPAQKLLRGDLQMALRESGRGSVNARGGRTARNLLVVAEIGLSLMLAIGAMLMARSVVWLQNEDRGFSTDRLLSFRVSFINSDLQSQDKMSAYFHRLLERIGQVPGATAVGAITNPPVEGYRQIGLYFTPEGFGPVDSSNRPSTGVNMINPDYFKATGIPIVRGREFGARDQANSPLVAIISSALARRYFPDQNPVGKTLTMPSPGRDEAPREIVGVAGDVRYLTRRPADSIEIYLPYSQSSWPTVYVLVRTERDPASLAPAIRDALRQSGWRQPISNVRAMDEWIATLHGKARLNSLLAGIFAGIALTLAAVGIYGVISYTVSQRTKEIGIRIAVGATPDNIQRWIVRQALLLAVGGVAIGLAGHFALSRAIGGLLYGTSPTDFVSCLAAAGILALVAIAASYIPARRAMRSDPVAALRAE